MFCQLIIHVWQFLYSRCMIETESNRWITVPKQRCYQQRAILPGVSESCRVPRSPGGAGLCPGLFSYYTMNSTSCFIIVHKDTSEHRLVERFSFCSLSRLPLKLQTAKTAHTSTRKVFTLSAVCWFAMPGDCCSVRKPIGLVRSKIQMFCKDLLSTNCCRTPRMAGCWVRHTNSGLSLPFYQRKCLTWGLLSPRWLPLPSEEVADDTS